MIPFLAYVCSSVASGLSDRNVGGMSASDLGSYDRNQFSQWVDDGGLESFISSVKSFFDGFFETIYDEDLRELVLYLFNCLPAFIRGFVCVLFIFMIFEIIDYYVLSRLH